MNRRSFLRSSAALASSTAAYASTAASNARVVGANDRIRFALIGCGGMGKGDLRDFLKIDNTECVGLCDVDESRIQEAQRAIVEPAGRASGLLTQDFREVLDSNDINAVIVATPDHWHALPTILACQAGKDVYVEKPLSLMIAEGEGRNACPARHGTAARR
jgi:predicted dehydrogenase